MKSLENRHGLLKTISILLVFTLVVLISLSFLYTRKVNFLSDIKIVSKENIKVCIETPLNKHLEYFPVKDTIFIESRPIKSILIIKNSGEYEINSIESLNTYNKQNDEVEIFIKTQTKSYFGIILWYWNTHRFLRVNSAILLGVILVFLVGLSILSLYNQLKKKGILFKIKSRIFRILLNRNTLKYRAAPIKLNSFNKKFLIILVIVVLPILFTHLNRPYSYSAEEKKRALVAFEMKLTDNYLEPSLAGEPYYNKPPVFNWFLIPFIKCENVEFATISVSVSFLIICSIVLFFLIKKDTNWEHALLTAFLFISSIYILLYFSLFLYIDGFLVLLLILIIYLNFRFIKQGKYLAAFVLSYSLCAIAFLTKGIPAIWFQAVSVISALLINRNLKKLLSYQHFIGILIFILIVGGYFYMYSGNSFDFVQNLFWQSAKVSKAGVLEIFYHILSFAGRNILFYLPLGLFFPLLFFKQNIIAIVKDKRLSYFAINILFGSAVFLTSPDYSQYYILMYVPLYIEIILFIINSSKSLDRRQKVIFILVNILLILPSSVYFITSLQEPVLVFTIIFAVILLVLFVLLQKHIVTLILFASFAIIGFRLFENKFEGNFISTEQELMENTKVSCQRISQNYSSAGFYLYTSETPINSVPVFYISYFSGKQVLFYDKCVDYENAILFLDKSSLPENVYILDSIPQMSKRNSKWEYNPLYMIKFDESVELVFDGT